MSKKTDDTPGHYDTLDPLTFQADYHTDLWIARRVMEWPDITENDPYRNYIDRGGVVCGIRAEIFRFGTIPDLFQPSSKMEDALEVLRKMREKGWKYIVAGSPYDHLTAVIFKREGVEEFLAACDSEPLAICRAAGLAVMGEQ